jgi:sugar lactone lactonase YvrE
MTQFRGNGGKNFEIIGETRSLLGEGISFNAEAKKLAWVDITGNNVFISDVDKNVQVKTEGIKMPSCTFPGGSDGMFLAHLGGIDFIDYRTLRNRSCASWIDPDLGIRCNDGTMDANGNIWISTMAINHAEKKGAIWFWDKSSKPRLMVDNLTIPNSLAVDKKRNRLYFGDSADGNIYSSQIPSSRLGNIEAMLFQNSSRGVPDGSFVDREGFLWNARWDGAVILKISPDGAVVSELELPFSRPTSCVILEADQDMYITSAKVANEPCSGNTIKINLKSGV